MTKKYRLHLTRDEFDHLATLMEIVRKDTISWNQDMQYYTELADKIIRQYNEKRKTWID